MKAHAQLESWISIYLLDLRAAGRSPKTISSYHMHLRQFQEFARQQDWPQITIHELRVYAAYLQEKRRYSGHPTRPVESGGLSQVSIIDHIRTLKLFFKWLTDERTIKRNVAARLKIPRKPDLLPRSVTFEDVLRLLDVATSKRDCALLWFLIDTGCRAAEACGLRWDQVQCDGDQGTAQVRGKGRQDRVLFLEKATTAALRAWRDEQQPPSEYVFTGLRGVLKPNGVYQILKRLKEHAGIKGSCHPHSFRHAFGQEWIRTGGDVTVLRDIMGHSDIAVTQIYTKLSKEERQKKHKLHSPAARVSEALQKSEVRVV